MVMNSLFNSIRQQITDFSLFQKFYFKSGSEHLRKKMILRSTIKVKRRGRAGSYQGSYHLSVSNGKVVVIAFGVNRVFVAQSLASERATG